MMKPIEIEVDQLLRAHYDDYQKRIYLTPSWYSSTIKKEPEKYPILASLTVSMQRREISNLLKKQGRKKRNNRAIYRGACWMLPEVAS